MAGFGRYIAMRVVNSIIVILAVLVLTLVLFGPIVDETLEKQIADEVKQQVLKGGKLGQYKSVEEVKKIIQEKIELRKKALGLDKPWYMRLHRDLWRTLTFNLGRSWFLRSDSGSRLVVVMMVERLPRTVVLFGTATILTIIMSLLLGARAAARPGTLFDSSIVVAGLLGYAFATWWVGMVVLYLFSYLIPVFPSGGMTSVPPPPDPFGYFMDVLWHLIAPVVTMLLVAVGGSAYSTRSLMINILTEDYILTARAKGVPERRVIYYHGLKMAAPPILTGITLAIAGIFTGGILTEIVFNWPGMGLLYWDAIQSLDIPVVMGLVYFSTLLIVAANLTADLLYGVVDPRIRIGSGAGA